MCTHNQTDRPTDRQTNFVPLCSIIVPVYNGEKYLAKCLDSLINQDYSQNNYEIIITDDGSTDGSGKICDEYAVRFPFIHVTHTENLGASHARNIALPQCRGEYITFCDADDTVSPQLISVLSGAIEKFNKPDVLVWKYFIDMPQQGWPSYNLEEIASLCAGTSDGEELAVKVVSDQSIGGFIWNKAVKRELILNFHFDDSIRLCMDHHFIVNMLTRNKNARVCYLNCRLYHYIQRSNVGQTRQADRLYTSDGMSRYIIAFERELELEDLSPLVAEQIKGSIYAAAIGGLYDNQAWPSDDVSMKIKSYLQKYWFGYYFRSKHTPISKLKTFIKRILSLLHIYKHKKITPQQNHEVK